MKNMMTAVILAGGKSSRINKDKTFLKIGDSFLLERTVFLLEDLFSEIMIVSSNKFLRKKFKDYKIISDEFVDCGPLGGIHVALKNAREKALFVFACDMPNLNPQVIQRQVAAFANSNYEAIIPRHAQGIEPLHAIYAKSCLPAIEKQLRNGNKSVRSFFPDIKVKYLYFEIRK